MPEKNTNEALKVLRVSASSHQKAKIKAAEDEIALLGRLNEMDPDEEYGIDQAI